MIFTLVSLIFSAISIAKTQEARKLGLYMNVVRDRLRGIARAQSAGRAARLRMRNTHKMATKTSRNAGRALSFPI